MLCPLLSRTVLCCNLVFHITRENQSFHFKCFQRHEPRRCVAWYKYCFSLFFFYFAIFHRFTLTATIGHVLRKYTYLRVSSARKKREKAMSCKAKDVALQKISDSFAAYIWLSNTNPIFFFTDLTIWEITDPDTEPQYA